MSRGMTIADFVQQVLYAVYKVRLDVDASLEGSYHSKSDKFKEVVMEANFVLQEFQKEQDWNFLRERWNIGVAANPPHGIQEFRLPPDAYKVCTGYNDAVRLHSLGASRVFETIPFVEARSGSKPVIDMYDDFGQLNVDKDRQFAFCVGDTVTFSRPWHPHETGLLIETDVIRYIEPLHICDSSCGDNCPKAYEDVNFRWLPDPYYLVVRTAAKRAEADPSATDRVQSLTDEASKLLSAMRENDSAHTAVDTYETAPLGYISVL